MPIYEYACGKCGHEFEAEQRITDAPIKSCPACRSRKVKKLISQTSFVLKGGGWYSDLYSSSGAKPDKADAKEAGDGAKPEKKSSDGDKRTGGGDKGGKKKAKGPKAAA